MKKNLIFVFLLFISYSFAATVPSPGGSGKISPTLPSQVQAKAPTPTHYNPSNIKSPFPTNKWFNSVLYACYDFNPSNPNAYSFKMYTYPQVFRCKESGLLIMYPKTQYLSDVVNYGSGEISSDPYPNAMVVAVSTSPLNGTTVKFDSTKLEDYSDFSATMKWEKSSNYMKATIGQSFTFSYFEFSNSVCPSIDFPYNWDEAHYWHNGIAVYNLYYPNGTQIQARTLEGQRRSPRR